MPIPPFQAGEVLSAMRLNAMVQIVNDSEALRRSFSQPFRQIEFYANPDFDDIVFNWMFRYVPRLRYYKVRYQWSDRHSEDNVAAYINNIQAFNDAPGGLTGTLNYSIDLARTTTPFNLIEGKVYTLDLHVHLKYGGDASDYLRVILAFMTNNTSYFPTIFVG